MLLQHRGTSLEWDRQSLPDQDFSSRRPRRRSSSADAVARFHRYYHLLRKNLGPHFTWKAYAKLVHDTFREYRTPNLTEGGVKKRGNDVATQAPEVQSFPMEFNQCTPKHTSWSLFDHEHQEDSPQRLSMRRKCRDVLVQPGPSDIIESPLSRHAPRKMSGENKSLVRDISSRIDRISTLARKKSAKKMKQMVLTFNKGSYSPLSSGYNSSERVEGKRSGSHPLTGTPHGKSPKTRKKIRMEVVEYAY